MPRLVTDEVKVAETQQKLGELTIAFSGVDLGLEKVFLALTGLTLPIGGIIFYEQDATSRRRQLVDKVAQKALADKAELLSRWTKLRDEHAAIHQRRNRFVHDLWAIDSNGGYVTTQAKALAGAQSSHPTFNQVDQQELVDLAKRARELMSDAFDFSMEVAEATSGKLES